MDLGESDHNWELKQPHFICAQCGLRLSNESDIKNTRVFCRDFKGSLSFYLDLSPRGPHDRVFSCKEFVCLMILEV